MDYCAIGRENLPTSQFVMHSDVIQFWCFVARTNVLASAHVPLPVTWLAEVRATVELNEAVEFFLAESRGIRKRSVLLFSRRLVCDDHRAGATISEDL